MDRVIKDQKMRVFILILVWGWVFLSGDPVGGAERASPVAIEDLSDRAYLPRILELLQGARRSIDVSMYQILLPGTEEDHPVWQILQALAEARGRGVRIRVLLNRHLDYMAGETVPLARSLAATEYLRAKGIEIVFAHPARRLHDKVIVIDERWVIEGSMNWTKTALLGNWESVALIDSPDYARTKLARIRAIPVSPEQTLDTLGDEGPLLEIPVVLMTEKKYFSDLLRRKDERILEFYLWLLKESQTTGSTEFTLEDETLFGIFRLDPSKSYEDKRREAIRLLKKLAKRGYLELKVAQPGAAAEVSFRAMGRDSRERFSIPLRYFDYGYPARLSLAAEFAYFLSRIEMAQSPSRPWWWRSQEYLTQTYNLHHTTLANGMLELQRANLIEVIRDDAPEGRPHSERLVNRYRLNRLVDPAVRTVQENRILEKFGREAYERARGFAEMIDEPNDFAVIATILKWMSLYPPADLDSAFEQVARYERNNPRRSLYYLAGILQSKAGR